jgi:hypothetical protein
MPEFRSRGNRSVRPPTSTELVRLAELRETGSEDIYREPESAPEGFLGEHPSGDVLSVDQRRPSLGEVGR